MELISKIQRSILSRFGQIPGSESFYLTGGTALAYFYLRHRQSNDLDFFTGSGELVVPFSHQVEKELHSLGMAVRRQRGLHSFVELEIGRGEELTLIHLAQDSPFRFEPTREFPEFPGLRVDNLLDIASNKLLALFGRATLRDFFDVFFLVRTSGFSRDELTEKAKKKDPGFDLYWLGVAFERMKTFGPASPEMSMLVTRADFNQIAEFFADWRREITSALQ